jgi:hypothetical protein
MEPTTEQGSKDRNVQTWTRFCPPDGDLQDWLAEVTAIAADSRMHYAIVASVAIPLTREQTCAQKIDPFEALEQSFGARLALREYTRGAFSLEYRESLRQPGKLNAVKLEVAVLRDLRSAGADEVAKLLGSREQPQVIRRRLEPDEMRYRGVDRIRANGRRLLASAGAWPWVVFPSGVLEAGWRKQRDVGETLERWHAARLVEAEASQADIGERIARARALRL